MINFNMELATSYINSKESFPIDFNDAWQWLEFSRKDSALRSFLECGFAESIDFAVFHRNVEDVTKFGGYKKVTYYYLSVDCFKTWSMMVNTPKGKEIRKYFLECEKQLKLLNSSHKRAVTYYSERLAYLKTNLIKPNNTWCVIEKCSQLLLDVEHLGYQVNQFDLLDSSVGKRWSHYRKGKDWTSKTSEAIYKFNDVRGERIINAYEYQEVGYFMTWLDSTYQTKFLPKYLKEKYGNLVKV